MNNIILFTDSYKASHYKQYPPNTTKVYSYIESRGGQFDKTVFFGLQYYLMEYLEGVRVTLDDINEAEKFFSMHGEPFNRDGWEYIITAHGGRLPVVIKAVKEGSVVPTGNILVSIENTDPRCYWLTSYLETSLLRSVWYPTTVASLSWHIRQLIYKYLVETGDNPDVDINFKTQDFGSRGVSSHESAMIGGAAHLVNFMGSDTVEGVWMANKYYSCDMAGFSIPAAEHSSITSWGKENEAMAYKNMLDQFARSGSLVAIVSDSYDIFNAVKNLWGKELRQAVIDSGATVIIRPDSGTPHEVVLKCVKLLEESFGSFVNSKGFKTLNHVKVIQGDGINICSIEKILSTLKENGYSADNVAFGMGGGLLQQVNRDTLSFAMKCSYAEINGLGVDVFKDPVTDTGKRSKKGRLSLIKTDAGYSTVPETENDELVTVFKDGCVKKLYTLSEVRESAKGT
jgi:nicotinamide phosphoribosyltransferase